MTHMYFSARAEGRISYGHLGRTDYCYYNSQPRKPQPISKQGQPFVQTTYNGFGEFCLEKHETGGMPDKIGGEVAMLKGPRSALGSPLSGAGTESRKMVILPFKSSSWHLLANEMLLL